MREALTDQDDDALPTQSTPAVTITQPRPDPAPRVATQATTPVDASVDAPTSARDAAIVTKLKDAGFSYANSDDPVGECTLSTGDKLRLRELDGEDETVMESFLDRYNVKPDGAGQVTAIRFAALMSISHENGREQAPVRHIQQLQRLLTYNRRDISRIVAACARFNMTNDDGDGDGNGDAPFR